MAVKGGLHRRAAHNCNRATVEGMSYVGLYQAYTLRARSHIAGQVQKPFQPHASTGSAHRLSLPTQRAGHPPQIQNKNPEHVC